MLHANDSFNSKLVELEKLVDTLAVETSPGRQCFLVSGEECSIKESRLSVLHP